MNENPFFESLRRTANRETSKWEDTMREADLEDTVLTENDIQRITDEFLRKIRSALHHREQYVDTLPELLVTLSELEAEWRRREMEFTSFTIDTASVKSGLYSDMSNAARDEMKRVQYIMEEFNP